MTLTLEEVQIPNHYSMCQGNALAKFIFTQRMLSFQSEFHVVLLPFRNDLVFLSFTEHTHTRTTTAKYSYSIGPRRSLKRETPTRREKRRERNRKVNGIGHGVASPVTYIPCVLSCVCLHMSLCRAVFPTKNK